MHDIGILLINGDIVNNNCIISLKSHYNGKSLYYLRFKERVAQDSTCTTLSDIVLRIYSAELTTRYYCPNLDTNCFRT